MPFGSQQWMYSSGSDFYSHKIAQSLRFEDGDSAYLNRTPASAGNRQTWTWSGWIKRGDVSNQILISLSGTNGTNDTAFYFRSTDGKVDFYTRTSSSLNGYITTDAAFRDPSAWYHFVFVYDSTNATAADRMRIYVNGVRQGVTVNNSLPQNTDSHVNNTVGHYIGTNNGGTYFDGYMAEVHLVDGQALDPTSFGQYKSDIWIPKSYSGSHGTNGFYLPFKNATLSNVTDAATITAPFGGTASNGKDVDGQYVTSNTSTGSSFTFIHYDLGSAKTITEFIIKDLSFSGGTSTWQLEYSTDNSSWTSAYQFGVSATAGDYPESFTGITARYWRLRPVAFGANGSASIDALQLFEGTLGEDESGNGNNWSSIRLQPTDLVPDSPTNNFDVLDILQPNAGTSGTSFTEGNLKYTNTSGSSNQNIGSRNFPADSVDWYFEARCNARPAQDQFTYAGINTAYFRADGQVIVNGSTVTTVSGLNVGDILGFAFGPNKGIEIYRNGSSVYSDSGHSPGTVPLFNSYSSGSWTFNFGQDSSFAGTETAQGNTDANGLGDFYYSVPSGCLARCTSNLPDPVAAIDPNKGASPQDYFNTVLYTGNAPSTQSITGVGFEPDMVWTKSRSSAGNHGLHDILRLDTSAPRILYPDLTNAESPASSGGLVSFDPDGFSLTNNNISNTSGVTYAAWNWKAGGTGVSNTVGGLTSTVSSNQDIGMSIVTFTTDGTNTSVGTGLSSSAPLDMVIIKRRDSTSEWQVGHRGSPQGVNFAYHTELNSTAALSGSGPYFMGTQSSSNGDRIYLASGTYGVSSATWVAYCFQESEGFSKFGSYTGNGSTDGTFVHCGFRPAFVITKNTNATNSWNIYDNRREGYNEQNDLLFANLSNAETDHTGIDLTSNGFKLRTTGTGQNGSGVSFIFMAFAEQPFKYANAR